MSGRFFKNAFLVLLGIGATLGIAWYVNTYVYTSQADERMAKVTCLPGQTSFDGSCFWKLQLFGEADVTHAGNNTVNATGISHGSGLVIDQSVKPNRLWVVDAGNSRILGYHSIGACSQDAKACTNTSDCSGGQTCRIHSEKPADVILGQPDATSNGCNGDVNKGFNIAPTESTLCLYPHPEGTNTGEFWMRMNPAVDKQGNLYIADVYNNRVLRYNNPLCTTGCAAGAGDTKADYVWGQANFQSNLPNRGGSLSRSGLWLSGREERIESGVTRVSYGSLSTRSVSIDAWGNLWVADSFNGRVLRFPSKCNNTLCVPDTVPDLLFGQATYDSNNKVSCQDALPNQYINRFCKPNNMQVHPTKGTLFIVDEKVANFDQRIIMIPPSSFSSQTGPVYPTDPVGNVLPLGANFQSPANKTFQTTGITFNTPALWNNTIPAEFAKGDVWFTEHVMHRVTLIDTDVLLGSTNFEDNQIVAFVGAFGKKNERGRNFYHHSLCGLIAPDASHNVGFPGGSVSFDDNGNMYIADEQGAQVSIYNMRNMNYHAVTKDGLTLICHAPAAGGMFGEYENVLTGEGIAPLVGVAATDTQLVVKDWNRYLIWNNYLQKPNGAPADDVYGQDDFQSGSPHYPWLGDRTFHTIDTNNRLWHSNNQRSLSVTQLPMSNTSVPLANFLELYWDTPSCRTNPATSGCRISYRIGGMAFDAKRNILWASDPERHRIYGIQNNNDLSSNRAFVSYLIGQPDTTSVKCNVTQDSPGVPTAKSLCQPEFLALDRKNNLYIVENTYECHGNNRIVVYMDGDLNNAITAAKAAGTVSLYSYTQAKKVFNQKNVTTASSPANCAYNRANTAASPIAVAFNSRNEMVVTNDGYYPFATERVTRQLWWYEDPLATDGSGIFIQDQLPNGYIQVPMGAGADLQFDKDNNLILRDHTWGRVWVINLDTDPHWIVRTDNAVTTSTPVPPTATPTPILKITNTPIPTQAAKPGDTDGDGDVDIFDYTNILNLMGWTGPIGSVTGDVDRDGDVDIFDYTIVLSNFGR